MLTHILVPRPIFVINVPTVEVTFHLAGGLDLLDQGITVLRRGLVDLKQDLIQDLDPPLLKLD